MSICTNNPLQQSSALPLCTDIDESAALAAPTAQPSLAFSDPFSIAGETVAATAGRTLWAIAPLPLKIGMAVVAAAGAAYAAKEYFSPGDETAAHRKDVMPGDATTVLPTVPRPGQVRPAHESPKPALPGPSRDASQEPHAIPIERRAEDDFQPVASARKSKKGEASANGEVEGDKLEKKEGKERKKSTKDEPAKASAEARIVMGSVPPLAPKADLVSVKKAIAKATHDLDYYQDPIRQHCPIGQLGLESLKGIVEDCDKAVSDMEETKQLMRPEDAADPAFAGQAFRLLSTAQGLKNIAVRRINLLEDAAVPKAGVHDEVNALSELRGLVQSRNDRVLAAQVAARCFKNLRQLTAAHDLPSDQAAALRQASRGAMEAAQNAYSRDRDQWRGRYDIFTFVDAETAEFFKNEVDWDALVANSVVKVAELYYAGVPMPERIGKFVQHAVLGHEVFGYSVDSYSRDIYRTLFEFRGQAVRMDRTYPREASREFQIELMISAMSSRKPQAPSGNLSVPDAP